MYWNFVAIDGVIKNQYDEIVFQGVTKLLTPKFYIFMEQEAKPQVNKARGWLSLNTRTRRKAMWISEQASNNIWIANYCFLLVCM
jgi:hypothetical protein